MISKINQLLEKGHLFFIPNAYPKYLKGKLRVFSVSAVMKAGIMTVSIYFAIQLRKNLLPTEVVIPYPQQPVNSASDSA